MNTDLSAHTNHRLRYEESVNTPFSVSWHKNSTDWYIERGEPIDIKAELIASELYCLDCDLYLTRWEF